MFGCRPNYISASVIQSEFYAYMVLLPSCGNYFFRVSLSTKAGHGMGSGYFDGGRGN